MSSITANGEVQVEGEFVGRLEGFRFIADETDAAFEGKAIASAARRALSGEIAQRVKQLETDEDVSFAVNGKLEILWRDAPVATLKKGDTVLTPEITVIDSEFFDGPIRERVRVRVQTWLNDHIETRLKMLTRLRDCQLSGAIRGLLFQLNEGLGCVPRAELESLIKDLSDEDRKALAKLGVRLGVETVHVLDALKPDPVELRGILWAVSRELPERPELPPAGRTSVPNDRENSKGFYLAAGYMPVGPLAARVDMLERFAALLRQKARENEGKVKPEPDLLSLLGCTVEQAEGVFVSLGWRAEEDAEGAKFFVRVDRRKRNPAPRPERDASGENKGRGPRNAGRSGKPGQKGGPRGNAGKPAQDRAPAAAKPATVNEDSPFARLKEMMAAKG